MDRPHPNPSPEGEGLKELAALAERAARLCKADLVTGMVGEFPELQGLIGSYYATAQGEDPRVAEAIRDHYKPVGQGDAVPTDPVTVAVALADKLDTIVSFFSKGLKPSGSKDPFALRRAGLALLKIIESNQLRLSIFHAAFMAFEPLKDAMFMERTFSKLREIRSASRRLGLNDEDAIKHRLRIMSEESGEVFEVLRSFEYGEVEDFLVDRLKVQQREAGVRHDLIDAVFALGGEDDLVRLLARVRALQAFITTPDGANLLAGYKRAANILKKEGWEAAPPNAVTPAKAGAHNHDGPDGTASTATMDSRLRGNDGRNEKPLSYTPEIAETALIAALDSAEPAATAAIGQEDFEAAMTALATLRAPIDTFFETVTVNDPDAEKRAARLSLLARVRAAVHNVADFSKIEG